MGKYEHAQKGILKKFEPIFENKTSADSILTDLFLSSTAVPFTRQRQGKGPPRIPAARP